MITYVNDVVKPVTANLWKVLSRLGDAARCAGDFHEFWRAAEMTELGRQRLDEALKRWEKEQASNGSR